MGRKEEKPKESKAKDDNKANDKEDEDPPVVKELKVVEDKYLELEREYEAEVHKIQMKYEAKQKPFLDERAKLLAVANDGEATGTPALPGFWAETLKNHPAFEDEIQEWDEPVLAYLKDITVEQLSAEVPYSKGFKLHFHFETNPYFEPNLITKEYELEEVSPYRGEDKVTEIKCTKLEWKAGKDVTVEVVQKKVKGGGAKKNKQKKEKEEPRESIFRKFFRSLKSGDPLPEDLHALMGQEDDDSDDDDLYMTEDFMETDSELAEAIKDQIVPFAVRWYTGEALPEDSDDGEDEESEEEDDSDDEEDEDTPPPKRGGRNAPAAKKKPGKKDSPAAGPADAPKEECKQQ